METNGLPEEFPRSRFCYGLLWRMAEQWLYFETRYCSKSARASAGGELRWATCSVESTAFHVTSLEGHRRLVFAARCRYRPHLDANDVGLFFYKSISITSSDQHFIIHNQHRIYYLSSLKHKSTSILPARNQHIYKQTNLPASVPTHHQTYLLDPFYPNTNTSNPVAHLHPYPAHQTTPQWPPMQSTSSATLKATTIPRIMRFVSLPDFLFSFLPIFPPSSLTIHSPPSFPPSIPHYLTTSLTNPPLPSRTSPTPTLPQKAENNASPSPNASLTSTAST